VSQLHLLRICTTVVAPNKETGEADPYFLHRQCVVADTEALLESGVLEPCVLEGFHDRYQLTDKGVRVLHELNRQRGRGI